MKWPGHEALLGEQRNTYRVLIKEPEAKLTFRMLRGRCENKIKTDLEEE
jgi:hypothetical protein